MENAVKPVPPSTFCTADCVHVFLIYYKFNSLHSSPSGCYGQWCKQPERPNEMGRQRDVGQTVISCVVFPRNILLPSIRTVLYSNRVNWESTKQNEREKYTNPLKEARLEAVKMVSHNFTHLYERTTLSCSSDFLNYIVYVLQHGLLHGTWYISLSKEHITVVCDNTLLA